MALATWWHGDFVPALSPLAAFRVTATNNHALVARLAGLPAGVVRARMRDGNRPYLAWFGSTPVAYGWSAHVAAAVGEYNLAFELPPANRYLWDFATLPAWRGMGVYPRLLQAIMACEGEAKRFWIIHLPENRASERGIHKAGLHAVGELTAPSADGVGLVTAGANARARAGAALLGVPLLRARRRPSAHRATAHSIAALPLEPARVTASSGAA